MKGKETGLMGRNSPSDFAFNRSEPKAEAGTAMHAVCVPVCVYPRRSVTDFEIPTATLILDEHQKAATRRHLIDAGSHFLTTVIFTSDGYCFE
jgi:hypothetical protein